MEGDLQNVKVERCLRMDSGKMGYVCKRKRGNIVECLLMEGGKIEGMSPKGRRKACGCLQAEKGERLCDVG